MNYQSMDDESCLIIRNILLKILVSIFNSYNFSKFLDLLDECTANPCKSISCQHGDRCIPIRNNHAESYKCLHTDYSSIDRCLTKPCEMNQQCINVYPNNHICTCLNCSLSMKR